VIAWGLQNMVIGLVKLKLMMTAASGGIPVPLIYAQL